jgi:hypothetical protein
MRRLSRQFNEPETLVRREPLDDGINGLAARGRTLPRYPSERLLRTVVARRRGREKIIVKAAASRTPVSSFSHSISPFA